MAQQYLRKLAVGVGFDIEDTPLARLDKLLDEIKANMMGRSVDKFEKDIEEAGKDVKKLGDAVQKVDREVDNLGDSASKTGTRFRTLGSAIRQVSTHVWQAGGGFKGFQDRALSAISTVRSSALSFAKTVGGSIFTGGAILGGAAAFGIGRAAKTSIGGAAEMELQQFQLEALVKDAGKTRQLFEDMNRLGAISSFSEDDFLEGAKTFLPLTKDLDLINQTVRLQERLAASNLREGMEGAAFSIREALSGDTVSLAERFNIPKSMLENLKKASGMTGKIKALDKILNDMGFTQEYLTKVNGAAISQWDNFRSNTEMALKRAGFGALERLKPLLSDINEYFRSGKADRYIKAWGDGLAWAAEKAIEFGKDVKDGIGSAVDFVNRRYLDNPEFQKLDFQGKFRFIVDDFKRTFDSWYEGGGNQQIAGAVNSLITFASDALSASSTQLTKIGADLGKSIGSGMITGLDQFAKENPKLSALLTFIVTPGPLQVKTAASLGVAADAYTDRGIEQLQTSGVLDKGMGLVDWIPVDLLETVFTFGANKFVDGSHEKGLSYVPHDNYIAELHRGERVLTAEENRDYSSALFNRYTPNATPAVSNTYTDSSWGGDFAPVINQTFYGSGENVYTEAKRAAFDAMEEFYESWLRRNPRVVEG